MSSGRFLFGVLALTLALALTAEIARCFLTSAAVRYRPFVISWCRFGGKGYGLSFTQKAWHGFFSPLLPPIWLCFFFFFFFAGSISSAAGVFCRRGAAAAITFSVV
jgi:hypothetical protein